MTVVDSHVPAGHSPPRVETTTNGSSAAADEDGELGADAKDDRCEDATADADGDGNALSTGLGDGELELPPQPMDTSRTMTSATRRPMAP
jgi:hypothetical protein